MPTITRSTLPKKRNCIEAETPSIPKTGGKYENIKNKKRKLAGEFTAHCQVNEKLKLSYQKTVSKKNKAKTITQVMRTQHDNVEEEKKTTRNTRSKLGKGNKIPEKSQKRKDSKVVNPSKTSPVINVSENIEPGKSENADYNQRRVSKAIEDISNENGKLNETLKSRQNHCSVSLEVFETNENITDDVACEETETSAAQEKSEEENYQHKYFQLLNMMKDLQEKFLISQQIIEQHVAANDDFLKEMKVTLDEERKELVFTKEQLETCKVQNIELEQCRKSYGQNVKTMKVTLEEEKKELVFTKEQLKTCKVQNIELEQCRKSYDQEVMTLSEKVEELTSKLLQGSKDKERESSVVQSKIDSQRDIISFYNLLTGLSLKKEVNDSVDDATYRCVMKTSEKEEVKFTFTRDNEFAEIEYKPLSFDQVKKGNSSLPKYLREPIFFEEKLAPMFLLRLLRAVDDRQKTGL